ncbi:MAG: hypothetical protein H6715_06570 [Myxococcales bacterium]|nr:hypothetical protein [Myxococcales bacterium]MCB9708567.1 hypothetical protein [Myxococcales bacterium]
MTEAIPLRFGHTLSFGSLLQQAAREQAVAQGLALAYGGFRLQERRLLLKSIESELAHAQTPLFPVLSYLLGTETDTAVARQIANMLAGAVRQRPGAADHAWMAAWAEDQGAGLVGFGQADGRFEVYVLGWDSRSMTEVQRHCDLDIGQLEQRSRHFREVHQKGWVDGEMRVVLDRICEILWRRRLAASAFRAPLASFAKQLRL